MTAMLLWAGSLMAVESEAKLPGKSIAERNVFNLRTPTPPAPPPAPPPPAIKVNLTGILNILGPKQAVLLVTEPGKPHPESKILQEGDREGDIEVLAIDEVAGTVKIKLRDQEKQLDFKTDGLAVPTAPASAFAMMTNLPPGVRAAGLSSTPGGMPMPITPPPNMPPGTIWRPDGTIIPPGGSPTVATNPAGAYQPPTRLIRTP